MRTCCLFKHVCQLVYSANADLRALNRRCGPCKLILPQLVEMAKELQGKAILAKFNCNKYNKELGISLGIKVAPTFLLYKDGEQVRCAFKHSAKSLACTCKRPVTEQVRA